MAKRKKVKIITNNESYKQLGNSVEEFINRDGIQVLKILYADEPKNISCMIIYNKKEENG